MYFFVDNGGRLRGHIRLYQLQCAVVFVPAKRRYLPQFFGNSWRGRIVYVIRAVGVAPV
jgi:hypothetical protein